MALAERAATKESIQQLVWKIHRYARENAGSMDSETHCKHIESTIIAAVSAVQKRLESAAADNVSLVAKNKELKLSLKKLEKEHAELRDNYKQQGKKLDKFRRDERAAKEKAERDQQKAKGEAPLAKKMREAKEKALAEAS